MMSIGNTITRRRGAGYLALVGLLMGAATGVALASANSALEQPIVRFLEAQNADAKGRVEVDVRIPDVRMSTCHSPRPFLPGQRARTSGRLTVGVRCPGDRPATRYFQAEVSIEGGYYVAARTIAPGDRIRASDIQRERGDITRLADNIATDERALLGKQAVRRIGKTMPIRLDMVERPRVIKRGDSVDVVARGSGFTISTSGQALGSAGVGGTLRVRTRDRAVVTGRVRDAHTVVVTERR